MMKFKKEVEARKPAQHPKYPFPARGKVKHSDKWKITETKMIQSHAYCLTCRQKRRIKGADARNDSPNGEQP